MLDAFASPDLSDVISQWWILLCLFIDLYKEVMHSAPSSHSESIPRSVPKASHSKVLP